MKLDPRIIEGKKPLTCFNTEMAKQFIGKECYFCDCPLAFEDLDKFITLVKGNLYRVQDTEKPFLIDKIACSRYAYCLPCEWVKPEKKYRPFSIEEWKFKHSVGETIFYRHEGTEAEVMYLGFIKPFDGITDESGKGQIVLGNNAYGLQNLFDNFEMWVDGGWKPFGIPEK